MPTLYDNFERVKNYVDEQIAAGGGEVTYSYLTENYFPLRGGEVTGKTYFSYYTTNNQDYGLKSYSHIIGGDQDKTSVTFLATQRKCGGENGTSYMAAFFTNSDGRSKFAHKSYTNKENIGGENDDAFMCFNAYGFKLAYSGEQGVAASTEYDVIHSGNISNYIPVVNENIIPKENNTYTLGNANYYYVKTYTNCVAGGTGIWMNINGNNRHYFGNSVLRCSTNNYANLGTSDYYWKATYTNSLYLNGTDIEDRLSAYVTKTDLSNAGYLTSVPDTYPTYTAIENMGYVTQTSLSNNSYATTSQLPIIDENLIPKTTNTYSLGDENHLYGITYTSTIRMSGMTTVGYKHYITANNTNGSEKLELTSKNNSGTGNILTISPTGIYTTNNKTLGTSSNKFSYAYINNLILNGTNIISTINGMFSYDTSTGTLTITTL